MSGILVLQKRFDYQSLPDDLFPPILLQEMRRHILKQHYHVDPFNSLQLVRVKNILANLVNDAIDEDKARMQLLLKWEKESDNHGC
ncbi:hypothetical protein G6F36_013703 [Rhizopus arrhizus]|nr:hypothetical protein G6F36_013703 [Rhizopus arrhizus]